MIHESLNMLTHFNNYLALLTGLPAVALSVAGGGLARTWHSRAGKFWLAFVVFLACSVPFSNWRGESFTVVSGYLRADFPILFILGGMTLTWKECRRVMVVLAMSAICTLAMERVFSGMEDGRLSLSGGTIANSNDYAAHLLLLLPFLLWVLLVPGGRIYKMICLPLVVAGLFVVLKSGSRGALIGMAMGCLIILLRGQGKLRWILGLSAPIVVVALFSLLPASVMLRFATITGDETSRPVSSDDKNTAESAEESSSARKYLLLTSLKYTLQHPFFGIGAGDFSSFEGGDSQALGKHGQWQETHNSYTQISSETGIPAVICYIGGIFWALLSLNRTMVKARRDKARIILASAFCTLLSMGMVGTCMAFLSLGYRFYLPALTGLAIALERVARLDPPDLSAGPLPAGGAVRVPVPTRSPPQYPLVRNNFPR
jgi:O-antigen ligase